MIAIVMYSFVSAVIDRHAAAIIDRKGGHRSPFCSLLCLSLVCAASLLYRKCLAADSCCTQGVIIDRRSSHSFQESVVAIGRRSSHAASSLCRSRWWSMIADQAM